MERIAADVRSDDIRIHATANLNGICLSMMNVVVDHPRIRRARSNRYSVTVLRTGIKCIPMIMDMIAVKNALCTVKTAAVIYYHQIIVQNKGINPLLNSI